MSGVGFVLLIMCANLANLMLVRGAARQRELAVRAAMGAGRGRLLWVTLAESVLLALARRRDGTVAVAVGRRRDDRRVPRGRCRTGSTSASTAAWCVFAIGAAIFTTFVVGVLPALRTVRPNLVNDLKEGGRGVSLGRGGQRLQAGLVVAQVALCFALLVGANLMVQKLPRACRAPTSASITARFSPARGYLAGDAYDDVTARAAFYRQGGVDTLRATAGRGGGGGHHRHSRRRWRLGRQLVIDGRTQRGGRDRRAVDRRSSPDCSTRSTCRCSRAAPSPTRRPRIRTPTSR